MLHVNVPASTVAAWHGHDVRMTTAVCERVYGEGLTAAASATFGDMAEAVQLPRGRKSSHPVHWHVLDTLAVRQVQDRYKYRT